MLKRIPKTNQTSAGASVKIRPALVSDINAILAVEASAWPRELQAPVEQFTTRLQLFPKGFKCAQKDNAVAGFTTSMVTNYDPQANKSWYEITDWGFCRNHNPKSDTLYIVSVAVHEGFQSMGIGSKLVQSQIQLARELKMKRVMLGARIPGYHLHKHQAPSEYILEKDENGEPLDPELRFYTRQGLSPTKLISNFEEDADSLNYGVVMIKEL